MPSYEKRPNGWSVRFRYYDFDKEVQKRLSGYRTKKDAELAYLKYLEEQPRIADNVVTFDDLVNSFLAYKKSQLRNSSYVNMASYVRKQITPYFSNKRLENISPSDIINWKISKQEKYSKNYLKIVNATLKEMFVYAKITYGTRNPFENIPKQRDKSFKVSEDKSCLSFEEFSHFIKFVNEKEMYVLYNTLYFTGMRIGECLALYKSDICNCSISISKSLSTNDNSITLPKTPSSIRIISIPKKLNDMLLSLCENLKDKERIFKHTYRNTAENLKKYLSLSNTKTISLHSFRHSHASYLLSNNISIVSVAKRLGHSNITQTLNTYAHFMPNDQEKIDNLLNSVTKM